MKETLLVDILPTHAFKQAPKLCKEMVYNSNNSKGDNNGGNQKAVSWLKEKFSMNKHTDMVKVPNQFLNIIRTKSEKLGETVSPTCLSILFFLRQAKLTDSQITTMNSEFNPTANIAEQNLGNCKANMKKFQHNGTMNL